MEKDPFKEYLKESEPDKAYKGLGKDFNVTSLHLWIFALTSENR